MDGLGLPNWSVFVPLALYALAAATAALRAGGKDGSAYLTAAAAVTGVVAAVDRLLDGGTVTFAGWSVVDGLTVSFRLDPLAAFFLLVVSLPALAAAVYGIGYLDGEHDRRATDALTPMFLGAMTLVVIADSVLGFLFAWELMSLVSFLLVLGDGGNRARKSAAYTYVVMTHVATGFVLIAFAILANSAGGFSFADFRAGAGGLEGWQRDALFVAALLGFGTKAGLVPLHVWLPKAHSAAPSHVSALMSGVMVKTAIYGLLRVLFDFTSGGPEWWGVVLITAGLVSALLGILYALVERDLKRLLAYSTVEHLGILTAGTGVALVLDRGGHQTGASLALYATLLHVLNHSVFKSLLFLGAGAVQHAAGSRDLEKLGGLIKRMPRTALFVLLGAAAISALPPLNGFASEWLLFQGFLQLGIDGGSTAVAAVSGIGAAALALTGALAVAAFVRAFGVGFLAQPKSQGAAAAHESARSMQLGMGLLAACAIGFGLGAPVLLTLIRPAVTSLAGVAPRPSLVGTGAVDFDRLAGSYAPLGVALGLTLIGVIPWLIARLVAGTERRRIAPPWVCGFDLEPRMQYTATSFSKALRIIFQFVIRAERRVTLDRPVSPYVVSAVRYEERVSPIYDRFYGRWVGGGLVELARRVRPFQGGSIRAYLGYVLVTLVVAILLAR